MSMPSWFEDFVISAFFVEEWWMLRSIGLQFLNVNLRWRCPVLRKRWAFGDASIMFDRDLRKRLMRQRRSGSHFAWCSG